MNAEREKEKGKEKRKEGGTEERGGRKGGKLTCWHVSALPRGSMQRKDEVLRGVLNPH